MINRLFQDLSFNLSNPPPLSLYEMISCNKKVKDEVLGVSNGLEP